MSSIVKMYDASNNDVYPITHLRAVRDSNGTTLESMIQGVNETTVGYYECTTAGSTPEKTITIDSSVSLSVRISCKVKFAEKNTGANATMNINNTGAKPLFYNGVRAAANNSWYTNEIVDLYFDGTNYQAKSCADTLEYDVSLHQTHEITEVTTTTRTVVYNGDVTSGWENETSVSDSSVNGYTRTETNTGKDNDATTVDGPTANYDSAENKTSVVYVTKRTLTHVVNDYTFDEAVNAVPMSYRHGGLKLRFISNSNGSVQNSDNKYVQYRLMTNLWSAAVADWQGVDDEPTAGSDNLVKSGGVADKISKLEEKTKDLYLLEEDSFIITDKNGNKIASFDKDGLHITSIEVLKDGSLINILNVIANKVDKVDGKQLSSEDFTTELKAKLENLVVNEDILDVYDGLCIVDGNGYKALEIDEHGDIRMNRNININGTLSGKSLYTLCDSLGTAGHWQKKLCDITGMVFDNNINVDKAHPLSAGGTKTSVSGMGTFTRAKNLVEYWKCSQGKTIDVLIIENINDMNDAGGHGDINDSAWCLTQQIVIDNVQSNSGAAESYFNNNVSSIVNSVTKKFGTTIRVPYSSGTAYRLQVTVKASQNGNITITIGSDVFIVGVNTEDSLADIAFKIAEYDFTNAGYSVYQDSETSVILTRTSSTQSVVVNTNSTGVSISNSTTTGVAYLDFCYIGSSLDSAEWTKLSNWMEQKTWSPISVVSLWARYKGLFDYLCKNLPDTKIFFMIAPRMSEAIANTYKKTDGTYDVKAWMDANNSSTIAVREIQKQVCKMYNIPVLDMWEEANFTLANAEYNYAGGSGVHPGINGYNRIGEAVARLINY